jgi:hypothetical protein
VYAYHFVIGTLMGLGLLAAAPDAWKRVFVVTRFRRNTLSRFAVFVGVGVSPFLVIIPLGIVIPPLPDGPIDAYKIFSYLITDNILFVASSLGLIACFLSSFNSALLASVHVGLIFRRRQKRVPSELSRFHWLMVTALVSLFLTFFAFVPLENPYLLGNLLLGPYAIIAGIQLGTRAMPHRLPENSVLWLAVLGLVVWFACFEQIVGLPTAATTYEINTVPYGAFISLMIILVCKILVARKSRHV